MSWLKTGPVELFNDATGAESLVYRLGDGEELGWMFEDNRFDLLPGEEKRVRVLGEHDRGTVCARPWCSPHTTRVDWRR